MSRLDKIESEYRLLQLERDFSEKKLKGILEPGAREILREARQAYRTHYRLPVQEGASPAPLGVKTKWQRIMEVLAD